MPIPDYQTLMLPVLVLAGDGHEHTHRSTVDELANQFKLTQEERAHLLPSGTQPVFYNRVHWARTYLKQAGLLKSTGTGKFAITPDGQKVLDAKPAKVDNAFLRQFPSFLQFHGAGAGGKVPDPPAPPPGGSDETPEELLESSYRGLRTALAQDLLDRIAACSPSFFERLVVDLLVAMGYGGSREDAGQAVGGTGDGGIDGIIKEDRLGLDAVYIQAKRWSGTVGRPVVQQFAGSLIGRKARKGVLITTSEFSLDAKEYVAHLDLKIVLIGGQELAQLLIDYGVGVKEAASYRVYKADVDYFAAD